MLPLWCLAPACRVLIGATSYRPTYQSSLKPSSGGLRPCRPSEGFYNWEDLAVGKPVAIYGFNLLITHADDCTKAFYGSKSHPTIAAQQGESSHAARLAPCNCSCPPHSGVHNIPLGLYKFQRRDLLQSKVDILHGTDDVLTALESTSLRHLCTFAYALCKLSIWYILYLYRILCGLWRQLQPRDL